MSLSNIIVVETYLGYYPVISKPREDVRWSKKSRKKFPSAGDFTFGVFGGFWLMQVSCGSCGRTHVISQKIICERARSYTGD